MKKGGLLLFLAGGLVFFLFVFFSYLVHKNLFTQLDFDTTVRLQNQIPRRFDSFFSIFSLVGSFEAMSLFLLVVLGIITLVRGKLVGFVQAIIAFLGFIGFHFIELYGKTFVNHLPPPEFMVRTQKFVEFPQFHIRQEFSYPSGHAGRAAFVSALLLLFTAKAKKLSQTQKVFIYSIIGIYDIIMFTSRIYLGEHWLTDVVGGIFLGGGLGIITAAF